MREEWTAEHLKRFYFVAVDCEQAYLDQDDVDLALIGTTVTLWGNQPMWSISSSLPHDSTTSKTVN